VILLGKCTIFPPVNAIWGIIESHSRLYTAELSIATLKPPNKRHTGNRMNSAVVSLVERLSSSQRFKIY